MHTVDVKGASIPALGFGTWQLVGDECAEGVADALALGYRHIDTARAYANEAQCGQALAEASVPRDQVWLTTKLQRDEAARDAVGPAVEDSLRALRTDYVDLLLLHWPVEDVPISETLDAMTALQQAGKVRHVGVSNHPVAHVREAAACADILTNQVEYHPLLDQRALLSEAARDGHALTAYAPLARGRVLQEPTLRRVADAHGKTVAQVTLRWLVQQPLVVALPRSSSRQRREENLDVFDFVLSDEEMDTIGGLAQPDGRVVDPPFAPRWDAAP